MDENLFKIKDVGFPLAMMHLKKQGFAKRAVIKNDTVIGIYKNRYYQINSETGIRYPYVPTNKDLMAEDWILIFVLDESIQKTALKNELNDSLRLLENDKKGVRKR